MRQAISKRLRFAVFERDGHRCRYCGAGPQDAQLHVDHVHPVSAGGTNDFRNLVTACAACNLGKAAYLPLRDIPEQREMALAASIFFTSAERFGEGGATFQRFQMILDFCRMESEPERLARAADEAQSWDQLVRSLFRVTGYPEEFWREEDDA